MARRNYLSKRKLDPSHPLHERDTMNIPPFNFDHFPFSHSTLLANDLAQDMLTALSRGTLLAAATFLAAGALISLRTRRGSRVAARGPSGGSSLRK